MADAAGGLGRPPARKPKRAAQNPPQATGSFKVAFLYIPAFMVLMAIGVWLWVPEHAGKDLNEISV